MNQKIIVDLSISATEYQRYYSGQIRQVLAHTLDGRSVRFPVNVLQQVVGHDGVRGRFIIEISPQGKFLHIQRYSG